MQTALRLSGVVQLLWCCLLIAGCATRPVAEDSLSEQCLQQLEALHKQVQQYQVADVQAQAVAGFPSYRTTRFWSAFATQKLNWEQQRYWRYQLHKTGLQGLAIEWSNLPQTAKDALLNQVDLIDFEDFEQRCGEVLLVDSLERPIPAKALLVEDSYNDWQRVLGLYALTKYAAAGSIAAYQKQMRGYFDGYRAGNLQSTRHYLPQTTITDAIDWATKLQVARASNPLSVPQLASGDLQQLAQRFAPELIVEQRSLADQFGAAGWIRGARQIDTEHPVVYFNPSYIRYRQQLLLQLNYTFWFPERPKPTRYDWYGGKLDGLVWRVTLNPDGTVLFFDSIHPCGCYHTVHLPQGSTLLQELAQEMSKIEATPPLEPVLFFQSALPAATGRAVLSVAAGTHYLIHVAATSSAETLAAQGSGAQSTYALEDYDQLRALPSAQQQNPHTTRSWFDSDGIIDSSARFERYFLWPLGVPSAGAMRQQGHHAIAFVGKRHFDEASVEALLDFQ